MKEMDEAGMFGTPRSKVYLLRLSQCIRAVGVRGTESSCGSSRSSAETSGCDEPELQISLVARPRNHSCFPINIDPNPRVAGLCVYYVCIGFG